MPVMTPATIKYVLPLAPFTTPVPAQNFVTLIYPELLYISGHLDFPSYAINSQRVQLNLVSQCLPNKNMSYWWVLRNIKVQALLKGLQGQGTNSPFLECKENIFVLVSFLLLHHPIPFCLSVHPILLALS